MRPKPGEENDEGMNNERHNQCPDKGGWEWASNGMAQGGG